MGTVVFGTDLLVIKKSTKVGHVGSLVAAFEDGI